MSGPRAMRTARISGIDARQLAGMMGGLARWLEYGDTAAHEDLARFLWGNEGPAPFDEQSLTSFDSLTAMADLAALWTCRFERLGATRGRR